MTQPARLQVTTAAVRIDERAVPAARHRIDREVASREIVLERHVGRESGLEAVVAGARLPLGARKRVLLAGIGVQKHREIPADRPVAHRRERFGGGAHHNVVALRDRAAQ